MNDVPVIDLTDAEVLTDPFTAYGRVREQAPLATLQGPGFGPLHVLTRFADIRAMLGDQRFEPRSDSFMRPDVPDDCLPYLRTMSETNGPEHLRLRRLVAPAFAARRAAEFRPRIERIVERLLDELPQYAENGTVDLQKHFTRPLPMEVICELTGIPEPDRPAWRDYGITVATNVGPAFAEAVPAIIAGAKDAVASRRDDPADDLISDLIRARDEDGDKLTETELVMLVWQLVLAGQTPANLIANAIAALYEHPGQAEALRADPARMPRAVEELIRWCGPFLLTIPRFANEDAELHGTTVGKGEAIIGSIAAAHRDPRAYTDPDRFDLDRPSGTQAHLGFAHGPHFCVGAQLARVQTGVALTGLLRRLAAPSGPALPLADVRRAMDPGTWRLESLTVAV
ncbi:cytochrome P450 family protein [Flindersiella endophytica]